MSLPDGCTQYALDNYYGFAEQPEACDCGLRLVELHGSRVLTLVCPECDLDAMCELED